MYCTEVGCLAKRASKGLCGRHAAQVRLYGYVLQSTIFDHRPAVIDAEVARIPLGINAGDGYAIVDSQDAWIDKYHWHLVQGRYPAATINGKETRMNRFLLGAMGPERVDHQDLNTLNNRRNNLRAATQSQNMMNRGPAASNTTGFKGVTRSRDKFLAQIVKDYKRYFLGRFDTAKQAALAYDAKALELHGKFARLNFPADNDMLNTYGNSKTTQSR